MATITSLGIGSGLDLANLVEEMVKAERTPTENRLNRNEIRAQEQLSALGQLRSSTMELHTNASGLRGFQTRLQATITGGEGISAQVSNSGQRPDPGSYQVAVTQLASAQSLASGHFADADASLGAGTLTIQVGDTTTALEFAEGASLREIRDAINASGAGIQAAVMSDGGEYRLLLTAQETGAAGEFSLAVDGDLDGRLASTAMTQTAAAQEAIYSINGLTLTSSSNRVENVLPGVTLELNRAEPGTTHTLTIGQDTGAVSERLGSLVEVYNKLRNVIGDASKFNPETGAGGPLLGDSSLRGLQSQLGGVFSRPLGDGNSNLRSMLDLGFSTDVEGRVSLDSQKLQAALREDPAGVEALIGAFGSAFSDALYSYSGPDGILQTRTENLENQLRRIADQRQALDVRMARVESRMRAQFSAMDALVAEFQSTSGFLEQQLASLADLRPQRKRR
jgi:flagellar hook-associated protein 2